MADSDELITAEQLVVIKNYGDSQSYEVSLLYQDCWLEQFLSTSER